MMAGVAGLVLAAGRSTRMGRPKALLRVRGRSFIAAAVSALRDGGCAEVVAVVGMGSDAGRAAGEAESAGALVVVNELERCEQVQSLRLGLAVLPPAVTGALVLPVDHPLIAPSTVRRLIAAHAEEPGAVVRPVMDGRSGHPTLFPRVTWPALGNPDLAAGARSVVHSPGTLVVDVTVNDAGVLADIDTPADYQRHVEGA